MNFQARQGDVWIERVDEAELPRNAEIVPADRGRVILAYGEVTGHAHAIAARPGVHLLAVPGQDERFLRIGGDGAELRHEEHATIALPPGLYRTYVQREYSPGEIRRVLD
ncbi:MAG: hypothetical protein AB7P40_00195 [Chloroflexota bacterium]